ncbi:hypothetical protein TGARI_368550 [Toxoplasma gondii ARI]|uniref:Uncharacterized protein n=1 Tax=Toxoplasma gondii ARI TaxID=1074872 RepID=A0A139Y7U9_TOXGO|nr:hypothetical protein TGARI_368550 [Toxoplasma gondii ARI]
MTKLSAKGEKRDELCLLWDAVQAEGAHNEQVRSLLGEIAVALTEANGELKDAAEVYRRKSVSPSAPSPVSWASASSASGTPEHEVSGGCERSGGTTRTAEAAQSSRRDSGGRRPEREDKVGAGQATCSEAESSQEQKA